MKQFTEAELRKLIEQAWDDGFFFCRNYEEMGPSKDGDEACQEYIDSVMEKL